MKNLTLGIAGIALVCSALSFGSGNAGIENVKVGADQILGGEGRGFANLMNELPRERLILALGAVAACEGMIERTIAYTQEAHAVADNVEGLDVTVEAMLILENVRLT